MTVISNITSPPNTFRFPRPLALTACLALCAAAPVLGQEEDPAAEERLETRIDEEQVIEAESQEQVDEEEDGEDSFAFGLGWLESTQEFASNRANALAGSVDRFFGVPRSDLEAAYSSLRLTWVNSWMEMEGYDTDLRVRGKVHLPRINERISLIFSEDEGDGSSYYQQGDSVDQQRKSTKLNLELNVTDSDRHRLDFRLGLRSDLDPRASARYRYERPFLENWAHRFTETAYYKADDGLGSISSYQIERAIGDNALLRWSSDVRFEETYTGAEWGSGITYYRRYSEETGISYYARVHGETSPDFIAAHDVGVRIRRNVGWPWFFIEVEPGYTWQKEGENLPRESSPYIFLRFEMAIGRLEE